MKKKSLFKTTSAVIAAALAAIYSGEKTVDQILSSDTEGNVIEAKSSIRKPMPVLKLNMADVENSTFVASHVSHRSHSSHRSHFSHRSFAG